MLMATARAPGHEDGHDTEFFPQRYASRKSPLAHLWRHSNSQSLINREDVCVPFNKDKQEHHGRVHNEAEDHVCKNGILDS